MDPLNPGAGEDPMGDAVERLVQALAHRRPVDEWLGRDEGLYPGASLEDMGAAAANLQAEWEADPDDEGIGLALAATHIRQSQIHLADDHPELAARSAASAVAAADEVIGRADPDERLDDVEGLQVLAVALVRLGEALGALGRPAEGGLAFLQVVELCDEVAARRPDEALDGSIVTLAQAMLADTFTQIERFDEAVEVEARRVATTVELDRGEPEQRRQLAGARARLARALAAADRTEDAIAEQARSVEVYDSVAASDLVRVEDRRNASWAVLNLALLQLEVERFDEAQVAARRAFESFVGLLDDAPTLSSRAALASPVVTSFDALSDALFESGRTEEADAIDAVSRRFLEGMDRSVAAAQADGTFV